ncbi:Stromal cell-derived factor 2-like protein [Homalodisca vitripennis]|nr:Stromal cell-derived factor 2-like protein [Homalodisca vitripennis]
MILLDRSDCTVRRREWAAVANRRSPADVTPAARRPVFVTAGRYRGCLVDDPNDLTQTDANDTGEEEQLYQIMTDDEIVADILDSGDDNEGERGTNCVAVAPQTVNTDQALRVFTTPITWAEENSAYLSVSGQTYGRPINGQHEIVGVQWPNSNPVHWKASEGLFIHPSDFNPKKQVHIEHTEL